MPNSITTNLQRLQTAKTNIGTAIDNYGFNLDSGTLTTYSTQLDTINTNINGALESCLGEGSEYDILISKTITANGTYNPINDDCIGYSFITVNVPPTGTLISKNINSNGTYNAEDDNADGYSSVSVNVSTGGYEVTITTIANGVVTLSKTGKTYTATANNNGIANFVAVEAGTYTVVVTIDDAVSDSTTITINENTATEDSFAKISVTAASDCNDITITNGTITKTGTYTLGGNPYDQYVSIGTWDVSGTVNNTSVSRTVNLSSYTTENVVLKTNTHWDDFRDLLRTDFETFKTRYPLGTLLYDDWNNTSSTAFRVVAYDHHKDSDLTAQGYTHSVTLLEEYLDYEVAYDAPEAIISLSQDLTAGTYYVKVEGTNYSFKTTSTIPAGGILTFDSTISAGTITADTTKILGYSSPSSATALFTVNTTSGSTSGTSLGTTTSNATTNVTKGTLNAGYRIMYGSNNYYQSGIRQLLNATTASDWWTPQTVFDRPTNTSLSGKLYRLNSDLTSVLVSPNITSIANNVGETPSIDGTTFTLNTTYNLKDKLFLVSMKEVNLDYQSSVGTVLARYSGAGNSQRIKYKKTATSTAGNWWSRVPRSDNAYSAYGVTSSGAASYYNARNGYGLAAACVIQ